MTHTKDIVRDKLIEALQESYLDGLLLESEYNQLKEDLDLLIIEPMEEREFIRVPQDNTNGYWATLQTLKI